MWASLLMDLVPFATGGGAGALAWYMRGAMGKVRDPDPKYVPVDKPLAAVIADGYKAVDGMARDIHRLYHPDGCKCVMCELRADDPTPEPPAGERCINPCWGCSVLTCDKHPDHGPANFTVMVDGQPVPARVSVEEPIPDNTAFSPEYIRALKEKINGLRKENAELRKGNGQRVVTKTVERKTALQNKIEQVMEHTTQGPVKLTLDPCEMTNGHPMEIIVGQQVEPESVIVKHGGEVVRKIYGPQSGPGSKELGIMDRQLGTLCRACERCDEGKAWVIVGGRNICKQCYYSMGTEEANEYGRATF